MPLPKSSAVPRPAARRRLLPLSIFISALGVMIVSQAGAQQTFNGGAGISVSGSQTTASSSTVNVSGATGAAIATVSVTVNDVMSNGMSGSSLGVADFVLTSPAGAQLVLLGSTGNTTDGGGLNGATITIADSASSTAPNDNGNGWEPTSGSFTVKPSSYWSANGFPPPFGTSVEWPQTDGSATLNGRFGGAAPDGTWTLSIQNFEGVTTPISIGSWSITFTYEVATPTNTSLSSSANPVQTGTNNVEFTATVTSSGGTPTGTVTFTNSTTGSTLCSSVTLSGGVAHCTTSLSSQGLYSILASYTPTGNFGPSSTSLNELAEGTPTHTGNQWCNSSSLSIPANTTPTVYPSIIQVSGYPAGTTVTDVTVTLQGATGPNGVFAQHLLVAPGGSQNLDFLDSAWAVIAPASPITATFFDTAGQVPNGTQAPTSGNYEAYDDNQNMDDSFPSATAPSIDTGIPQVPGTVNFAAPRGGTSALDFETAFNGAAANGDWALYTFTDEAETLNSGWCIDLDISTGVATTTTVTSSKNPQTTGQSITFTATVKAGGSPVTSGGTVTFLDNGSAPAGTSGGDNVVTLNSIGQATFTTSSLSEGDHTITADYSGTSTDNPSLGSMVQRLDDATTITALASNVVQYCNTGGVTSAQGQSGAFTPNPSNIFVTNLPGTISSVTLTLDNFYTQSDQIYEIESLVSGPSTALDFFSNTGLSNTVLSEGNYTFADSASSDVPQSAFGPGSYKPTSYANVDNTADSFFSSSSGFYPAPTSFSYSPPQGSSTFGSKFSGANGNGTWGLFFDQLEKGSATGAVNGWCLNFTENAVPINVTKAHVGTFTQAEPGAQYTINVMNNGSASTGDPSGNFPLKVTDSLPTGLTYAGFSGTSWTCSASGQSVTCTNDSPVAASSSYPTLTLDVNVSASASGTLSNTASVSGAGVAATNSNTDQVTIEPPAILAVSKTHTGTFTQGQTAQWQIAVSNDASAGTTYGTINVADALPTGFTLNSYTSTASDWSCGGSTTVTCSTTAGIGAGSSSTITLTVNVPANSPKLVSNTALAWGGGDLTHTSQGSAVSGTDSNVPVVQVPASVTINGSGSPQSAIVGTAFSVPLSVTVADAGSVAIANYTVTFTAIPGGNGQTGTFSNSSGTIQISTNSSGQADAGTFTAGDKTGAYGVTAVAGPASATFSLSNTSGSPASILISEGNNQQAQVRTAYATPLEVTVDDQFGNPVPGASVTFTAPTGATPSATFAGSNSIVTSTNIGGLASSGTVMANTYPGAAFAVQASSGSVSTNFQLTNLGISETNFASLTATAATIDVLGLGFFAPGGHLSFTDNTSGTAVAGTVTLNVSNATPGLAPQVTTSTGTNTLPDWTEIADVNGDGKPDLITSIYQTDSVNVQIGNGDGTFGAASPIQLQTGFGPAEVHAVSLRGNSTLDLIIGSFNLNKIAVLLGEGNGMFESPVYYTVGSATNTPTSLTTGDFNHDGNLDVAVANTGDNTVSILLGDGNGNLTLSGTPIGVGHDPEAIRAGDFNGDGYSDLAVANYQDGTVTLLVNNENNTFTASTISVGSGHTSGPQALAITGTGASLKLAVANYKDNTVSVMNSNDDGTFGAQTITAVGKGPDDLTFTDFNNDGIPDLAVSNYTDGSVDLLIGSTNGSYSLVGPFPVGAGPYSAAVGDIDLDGTPDVVVSNCFSNNTGALLGGTQIAVPYTGLTLTAGHSVSATYTPNGASDYTQSTSPTVTAP